MKIEVVANTGMDGQAKEIVRRYAKEHLDKTDGEAKFDVFIVWKVKALQNWKWLLSTTLWDGMYYELTYNGDKREFYLDAYKKFENDTVTVEEVQGRDLRDGFTIVTSETFDFGYALRLLKQGKKVARKGWNGKGQFVYYVPADRYVAKTDAAKSVMDKDGKVSYRAYLALKTAQGDIATWVPSISDCLAEDWEVVE